MPKKTTPSSSESKTPIHSITFVEELAQLLKDNSYLSSVSCGEITLTRFPKPGRGKQTPPKKVKKVDLPPIVSAPISKEEERERSFREMLEDATWSAGSSPLVENKKRLLLQSVARGDNDLDIILNGAQ